MVFQRRILVDIIIEKENMSLKDYIIKKILYKYLGEKISWK